MKNSVARGSTFCAAIALTAMSMPAGAQTKTASSDLGVSANVAANCTISTSPVAFGEYAGVGGIDEQPNCDAAGALIVSCTSGTEWSATSDVGQGLNANYSERRMQTTVPNGDQVSYRLYTDAARTILWGDTTNNTQAIRSTGTGASQDVPVYGRIIGGQVGIKPGDYSDIVAVTLNY